MARLINHEICGVWSEINMWKLRINRLSNANKAAALDKHNKPARSSGGVAQSGGPVFCRRLIYSCHLAQRRVSS